MGVFDTYIIPCPHCNSLVEEQVKPGYMNTHRYGEDPEQDMMFVGPYTCYTCNKSFTIELETVPRTVIRKME